LKLTSFSPYHIAASLGIATARKGWPIPANTYPVQHHKKEWLIRHLTHIPSVVKDIPTKIPILKPYRSSTQVEGKLTGMKTSINMKPMEPITVDETP
jgi:hypothetical protein